MTRRVAALLFFSGFSALVYQTVWLRQFRLIFGASTYATGAVLAVFMAGLGIGSALLGKRADAKPRPLAFYAQLELLIAAAAAVSPLLLWIAAKVYFSSGGSPELGVGGATALRLVLALIVLGPATLLMGGTLPAAARAVETSEDSGRRAVALLYGVNALGAVAGTLLSTFFLLETFGNRLTLFFAVVVNVGVGIVALAIARDVDEKQTPRDDSKTRRPDLAIYAASAITGFAFLLMELVWYRMLAPILGGTTYMFGLILAMALLGIGLGGAAYAFWRRGPATAGAFAVMCGLEALAVAVPFALGDRLAVLANVLRDLGVLGFGGHVAAWTLVTAIVVFPAAFFAGIQFPMLISLLGRGREHVGRQIGAAYAWNTAGAIAGSLAGGFGLIPLLSAPVTWSAVAILLALLAVAAAVIAMRGQQLVPAAAAFAFAAVATGLTLAQGPTAMWRHGGIGGGIQTDPKTRNELRDWATRSRRALVWDRDGRESSVALIADTDLAFVVNGKSDGSAVSDAGTQIMAGILTAALHPLPKSALVIGLGTGSTAGWLGAVPTIQRVDVAELEPVVLDVARACHEVNAGVMTNPKVHITVADAREMLLTSNRRYDLIFSEPSNPYRAGVASLFTRDFYEAASARLERGGYFGQWLQMYGIRSETVQTVYATLTSVFPNVQTWRTNDGDLVLLASKEPIVVDADALRARLATEPYRAASFLAWRVDSLEGFLSHHIANETFAREAAKDAPALNTDDRPVIEFGFARTLNERADIDSQVRGAAIRTNTVRPVAVRGAVDWRVTASHAAQRAGASAHARQALQLASAGDERAVALAQAMMKSMPIEAQLVMAELRYQQKRIDEAAALLAPALVAHRRTPWVEAELIHRGLGLASTIGLTTPERARMMHGVLAQPFAASQWETFRRGTLIQLAARGGGCGPKTIAALRDVEPHPFWEGKLLRIRAGCYERAGLHDLAERALDDLAEFEANEPAPIVRPQSRRARP